MERNIPLVNFYNITEFHGKIAIEGFVKNSFGFLKMNNQEIGIGSITDGHTKLEIHLMQSSSNCINICDIHKGHRIRVIGELIYQVENTNLHLKVDDESQIRILNTNKALFSTLLSGYHLIQ